MLSGRTIQGAGGGGLLALTYVVISDLFEIRGRAKALSGMSVIWLVGVICGPILSGGFTTDVSWASVLPFFEEELKLMWPPALDLLDIPPTLRNFNCTSCDSFQTISSRGCEV